MAFDIVGPIADAWVNYVFGSMEITVIVVMIFVIGLGISRNWPLDLFIVTIPPLVLLMSLRTIALLPPAVWVLVLLGFGLIVGVGMLRLIRQ